ncbi:MAG: hypothetical protein AABX08_03980 [Nanoarchaeota archaeon]
MGLLDKIREVAKDLQQFRIEEPNFSTFRAIVQPFYLSNYIDRNQRNSEMPINSLKKLLRICDIGLIVAYASLGISGGAYFVIRYLQKN